MRVNPQLRVTVLGAGADHLRALQHPCLQFIETLKGRALYFPEVCAPPMGASADDTLHVFIEQNLKFAFPHLDAESLSELEKIVRMHLLEFHNHGAARRNPEVVCGVEFDDAFAPEALREVRAHYPAFVQFVANLKSTDVILPKRVRAMTPEEVAFGKGVTDWGHEDGAGHGIYFPDEDLIALNSTMTPAEILKYFVHENLHAAYPTLHEVDIRNLTDYVVWELTR